MTVILEYFKQILVHFFGGDEPVSRANYIGTFFLSQYKKSGLARETR